MTDILIPKFKNNWHYDSASAMEEQLRKMLDSIIEQNAEMKSYFVLIIAYPDPFQEGVIRQKILHGIPPEALKKSVIKYGMLGTILYWRDNENMQDNEILRVWVLPKDVPIPEAFLSDVVDNPNGALSAWNCADDAERLNMPILLS
jgi:hypothetical protein